MTERGLRIPVTVGLSAFTAEALAGEAGAGSKNLPARLVRAIRVYLRDRDSARPGWPYPSFLRNREPSEEVKLQLSVPEDLWGSLQGEAERQEVSLPRMVEHVVLYAAAEIDAGRFTERILEDLEDDGAE